MNFYLPIHLDGGNRGCEAITKATAQILGYSPQEIIALSKNQELDNRLHLGDFVTIVKAPTTSLTFRIHRKLRSILVQDKAKLNHFSYSHYYDPFLNQISSDDVMISTGGDMMCYVNNEVIYTNEELHKRGVKTFLWGCSIGEENLTPEKISTLRHFTKIYARESLTAKVLMDLKLSNVFTFPDPAFILQPEKCELPAAFFRDVIGLNLSNFILGDFSLNTPFGSEVISLINSILKDTNLNILLIPHVFWANQDDRIIVTLVADYFNFNPRIFILDSDSLNYCQIRYVISKCRYFIGARTHAVISAYSTCVPTIALGYSIKSKGSAKDLELPENLVVDSKKCHKKCLVNSFEYLVENENQIRQHLMNVMPDYIKQIEGVGSFIVD